MEAIDVIEITLQVMTSMNQLDFKYRKYIGLGSLGTKLNLHSGLLILCIRLHMQQQGPAAKLLAPYVQQVEGF